MALNTWSGWVAMLGVGVSSCGGQGNGGVADRPGRGGTSESAQTLPFAKAGLRLQALAYVADGVAQFRTLHDSKLGFDCEFAQDASGAGFHCIPPQSTALVFLDAQCSQPAMRALLGTAPGAWVSAGPAAAGCPGAPLHREAFQVGEEVYAESPGAPPLLYELTGGTCAVATPWGKYSPAIDRLIPHAESELVAAHLRSIDVGGGLHVSRFLAEEGAELTVGVTGVEGRTCTLVSDGECVPGPLAVPSPLAVDADCTRPAFSSPYPVECGLAQFGAEGSAADTLRLHRLEKPTALFSSQPVDQTGLLSCVSTGGEYLDVFAAGADVTGSFPKAQQVARGTGSLHVDWFVSQNFGDNGGVPLLPLQDAATFLDNEGKPCQVTPAVDGTLRCATLEPSVQDSYNLRADASCSVPLYVSDALQVEPSTLRLAEHGGHNPDAISAIYTFKVYDGAAYLFSKGACFAMGVQPGVRLFIRDQRTEFSSLPLVRESLFF